MRIASVPTWKFADVVVKNGVWGSNRSRFSKWGLGETLIILVGKEGVVVATVAGKAFSSDQTIWADDLYEYRIPVHVKQVFQGAAGSAANRTVREALTAGLDRIYGAYIVSQTKLPEGAEKLVQTAFH